MDNNLNEIIQGSSKPLASDPLDVSYISKPTNMFGNQKPDFGEARSRAERYALGLIAPRFLNGSWSLADTNLTMEEVGDEALAQTIQEGSKGWGEQSILGAQRLIDQATNSGDALYSPGARQTRYVEQFVEGFNFGNIFGENETLRSAAKVKEMLKREDPSWTLDKQVQALEDWKSSNPTVAEFVETAGIDLLSYVAQTRNPDAFYFNINEAVQQANLSIGMNLFNEQNNFAEKFVNSALEGIKDPLILRDMVLTSIATAGLGAVATTAGVSARALSGAVSSSVNASKALKGLELVRKAANAASLATGPMTGIVEGPAYAAIRAIVPSVGRQAVSTMGARGLALALEGAAAGTVSSIRDQYDQHEWRSLVFKDVDSAFKFNLGETAMAAVSGSLGSVGLASLFRFGLGTIGDYKYYRTGDWDGLSRQITNSMDSWATTKQGDIVYGNTLSDGRGIFFGDVIDRFMKKQDGRDFTNVMLNGDRLFGKFNPRIAGKMNLDVKSVLPIIDEFEKATGIAGEAVMLKVDGVAPETRSIFNMILNEKNLEDAGLTLNDVKSVLQDYNLTKENAFVGPRAITLTDETMKALPAVDTQIAVAEQLQRVIAAKGIDRKLETIGVSSRNVIANAETTLGRNLNLSTNTDFKNFVVAAKYAASSVDEGQVVETFTRMMSGDFGGGRTIPTEVVQSIFKSAFGDKPVVVTASGDSKNFAVVVDPTTKEVFATKRTLKKNDGGNLEIELRADDKTNKFFTADSTTIDADTFQAKLVEVNEKLNKAWNEGIKKKIKDKIDSVKSPRAKTELRTAFAEGKAITVDNIKKIFDFTKTEATAAKLIMDVLGYSGDDGLLRIASLAADDRNAEIAFEGTTALIRATKASDIGTVTHEMSHYLQVMILDDLTPEARQAIGITDDMWDKFKDWVGYSGTEWSVTAAEKFANGMSQYVRRVMSGDGRAPTTQVQRLFHRIGDHLGELGVKFKSQEALEAGLVMSSEAEAVFEALFNRSNSKIGELFDNAYQTMFKRLSKERRYEIGKEILGEVAFNDYIAKSEIEIEKSKIVVDRLAKAAAVKAPTVASVVEEIYTKTQTATRKFIKEALAGGELTKEEITEWLIDVDQQIGTFSLGGDKPSSFNSATKLSDDQLDEALFALNEVDGSSYVKLIVNAKPKFLGGTKADPQFITDAFTRESIVNEINRRREVGIKKVDDSLVIGSDLKAELEELFGPTGFADSAGTPISLTPTEVVVATRTAAVVEASKAADKLITDVTEALKNDATVMDAASITKPESKVPDVINVEEKPVDLDAGLVELKDIGDGAASESARLAEQLPTNTVNTVKAMVGAVVANSPNAKKVLLDYMESIDSDISEAFIVAELRSQISRTTVESISGLDSESFDRFLELSKIKLTIEQESALDIAIREQTPAALIRAVNVLGWSAKDVEIYVAGYIQRTNGSLISEFTVAKDYVAKNIKKIKQIKQDIADNEVAYKEATVKLKESTLTNADKEKLEGITKKYNAQLSELAKFNNAVERIKVGVLRTAVADVSDANLKVNISVNEKAVWLNMDTISRSPKLLDLIAGGMDIADIEKILSTLDSNADRLIQMIESDGVPSKKIAKQFATMSPIEKLQAWAAGDIKSTAAVATVRKIIKNLEANAKRKLESTKKKVGAGDIESSGGETFSVMEEGAAVKAVATRAEKEDFYFKLEEETTALRFVAGSFYDHLVRNGKDELAQIFIARRQGLGFRGATDEATATVLKNFGLDLSTSVLNKRFTNLRNEFAEFVAELPEDEAKGLIKAFQLEKKEKKPAKVLAQRLTNDQLDELDSLLETIQADDVLTAPDFLVRQLRESNDKLYEKIITGEIETVAQALEAVADDKSSRFAVLAAQLLEQRKDLFDNVGVHIAHLADRNTEALYSFNNVYLNVVDGKVNTAALIHEVLHAMTAYEIADSGMDALDGAGAEAYIGAVRTSLETGVGPNGKKLKPGVKSIMQAYVSALDWIERTPEAVESLGDDYLKYVGKQPETVESTTHYALTNLHEFVANILSDKEVLAFFAAVPTNVKSTKIVKEVISGVAKSIWPKATGDVFEQANDILRKNIVADLVTGAVKAKPEKPDPLNVMMPLVISGITPFKLIGGEIQIPSIVSMETALRNNLRAAKGRVYAQLKQITEEEAKGEEWTLEDSVITNEYGEEFQAFDKTDAQKIVDALVFNELAYIGETKYFETDNKTFVKIKQNEKVYDEPVEKALQLILNNKLYDPSVNSDVKVLTVDNYDNSNFALLPYDIQANAAQAAYTKLLTISNSLPSISENLNTHIKNASELMDIALNKAIDGALSSTPKVKDSKYFKKLDTMPYIVDEWVVGTTHSDIQTDNGFFFKVKANKKDNAFMLTALLTKKAIEWTTEGDDFIIKYTPENSELNSAEQKLLYYLFGEIPQANQAPAWEPTIKKQSNISIQDYFDNLGIDGIKAVNKFHASLSLLPVQVDSPLFSQIEKTLDQFDDFWYTKKSDINEFPDVGADLFDVPVDDVQPLLDNYTKVKLEVDSVFPENAKIIGPQLGSNPGHQVEINGSKYYLKAAKSKRHANMERAAQELYRMLNHSTLVSEFTDASNLGSDFKTSILTPWLETNKFDFTNPLHLEKAKKLYVASAWLANWDIFGMTYDNVSAEGIVLDTGGSLVYRARGAEKEFSSTAVKELDSLRDSTKNKTAANIFANLTVEEMKSQAANLETLATNERIRDIVFDIFDVSNPLEKADADKLVKTLIARKQIIVQQLLLQTEDSLKMPNQLRRLHDNSNAAATEEDIFYIREAAKSFENSSNETKRKALEFMHTVLQNANLSNELLRSNFYNAYTEFRLRLFGGEQLNRRELLSEFFTDDSGRDIAIRDDLGIPITFYRGTNRPDIDAQNGSSMTRGSWWGTDLNVARDYGGQKPIMSAFAAVRPERIKVIKLREMTHWSNVKKSDILDPEVIKYLEDRNFNFGGKVDDIAFAYLDLVEDKYDAVRLLDVKDYAKLGTKKIPHDQWVFRPDKQLLKNRNALEFKKTGQQSLLSQKRAVQITKEVIDVAKSVGANTADLESKLAELVDSAEVRRRNLVAAGLHEEMEPEDIEIIQSMVSGTKAFSQPATSHLLSKTPLVAPTKNLSRLKFSGKNYRDLTDDERRTFVADVLLPTVEAKMGKRNRSAGIYSLITDSKVGKGVNSLVGGGAAYGDTADADSLLLQFFSKIYDPLMDLRDGELSGVFDLFSVDMVNAETNNMYSRAGLLDIQRKIISSVSDPAELSELYETAWTYLANLGELPETTKNRELVIELIRGVHKYNTVVGDTLERFGSLSEKMKPEEYGTIHKVNMLAFEEQERFVDALVTHALKKEREGKDLSIITMDALGWIKLVRDSASDDIREVIVPEGSPLTAMVGTYKYTDFKKMAKKSALSTELLTEHDDALTSSKNYRNWDIYKSRGDSYSAIRHTMTVAKNRYLDIESTESRGGKPRTEGVGGGREMDISRILSHSEIANNPELARYFDKDIFGLINQQLRSSVTDAIMTKYISETFGVKMSWLDLIEVSRKHGEASRGVLTKTEQDSVNRGYDRLKTIWEANTGRLLASRDGLDRHYAALLESGSRPLVLSASGLRAAVTSTGETVRAILTSNHNKGMLKQVIPNFIQTLKLFSRNKRQTLQQVASATHWIRGLSSDHLLLRAEMNPNNPFGGTIMGARQGGFFSRWAQAWRGVAERNKLETSIVGKAANYLSVPASQLGAPLAMINDVTTSLHVYNAQHNLTLNSKKFLDLANAIKDYGPDSLKDFGDLAKRCGLSVKEAIDLSTMGLLDPDKIKVMIEAAKDQRNYVDGLLDVQRLFIWANDDEAKIDVINRMGAFINATARHTNTDPTLLDLRINQSAYSRSMGVFMQFLLSHSVQEIGRRRRYTATGYSKHLAGLVMMEAIAYSLARTKDDDDNTWIWEDAKEKPFETVVKLGTSLPLLGSYQYLSALLRAGILEAHTQITGENTSENYRVPDLYSGPSENIPRRAIDMIKDLL